MRPSVGSQARVTSFHENSVSSRLTSYFSSHHCVTAPHHWWEFSFLLRRLGRDCHPLSAHVVSPDEFSTSLTLRSAASFFSLSHFVSSAINCIFPSDVSVCKQYRSHPCLTLSQQKSNFVISRLTTQRCLILVSSRLLSFRVLSCLVLLEFSRALKCSKYYLYYPFEINTHNHIIYLHIFRVG